MSRFLPIAAAPKRTKLLIAAGIGVLTGLALAGCSGTDRPPLELASHVDLDRYAGRWYIIANIPYFAERGNVASYFEIRFDGDKLTDIYNARKGGFGEPYSQNTLHGYVVPDTGNARWRESPFWPLYLSYLILYVDPDYQIALVGYPGRGYGWVMSRQPTMDDAAYQSLLQRFRAQGYDPARFARVAQQPDQIGRPGFQ